MLEESETVRYVTERGRGGNLGWHPCRRTTTTWRRQEGWLSRVPSRRKLEGPPRPWTARPGLSDPVSGPPPPKVPSGTRVVSPQPLAPGDQPRRGASVCLPPMRAGDALRGRDRAGSSPPQRRPRPGSGVPSEGVSAGCGSRPWGARGVRRRQEGSRERRRRPSASSCRGDGGGGAWRAGLGRVRPPAGPRLAPRPLPCPACGSSPGLSGSDRSFDPRSYEPNIFFSVVILYTYSGAKQRKPIHVLGNMSLSSKCSVKCSSQGDARFSDRFT